MNRVTKLPPNLRAHLYPDACDMRRSFDGLHALVRERLRLDPLSGDRFLFANRRKNRVKVLYWDGSGLVVLAKRFEHGVFAIPSRVELKMDEMDHIERPRFAAGRAAQAISTPRRWRQPPESRSAGGVKLPYYENLGRWVIGGIIVLLLLARK